MRSEGSEAPRDAASTLEAVLASRRSCRAFAPRPVPRHVIERILRAAQRTPSWCNAQPWHVHLVSGARLDRLREALLNRASPVDDGEPDLPFPREYRGVYRERRRACGWALYEAVGIAKGDRAGSALQAAQNFKMFGAPHVAVISSDEALGTYGAVDCGAYVTTFMLAAESLGVASVAQAAIATYPEVLRAELGISEARSIVCGVAFGYADHDAPANGFRTIRAELDESVSWIDGPEVEATDRDAG